MKYILFFLLLVSVTCTGQIYQVDASGGGQIVRYYTTDSLWTKPVGLIGIQVIAIGGGGGGAAGGMCSGACGIWGGRGGGGGAYVKRYLISDSLSSTENITIGISGTGGPSIGFPPASSAGTNGGDTSFGTLVVAKGGAGGIENSTGGAGGSATTGTPQGNIYAIAGQTGSNGTTSAAGTSAPSTGFSTTGINGGGGGGGCLASTSHFAGGNGGAMRNANYVLNTAATGGAANGGTGANGIDNYSLQLDVYRGNNPILTHGVGTSGAGGGGSYLGNGGNGGNGGLYGSGGGGGGGAISGVGIRGAGGNGAQGLCIVIEYY